MIALHVLWYPQLYGDLPLVQQLDLAGRMHDLNLPLTPEETSQLLENLRTRHPLSLSIARRLKSERLAAYRELSRDEGQRLAMTIIGAWKSDPTAYERLVEEILLHLACLVPDSVTRVRDKAAVDEILSYEEVYQELSEGQRGPRYYHNECYQLIPKDQVPAAGRAGPATVITPQEGSCGWCGGRLTTLFDVDLQDQRLRFLAPGWKRLRIGTCTRCTLFETVFTEVDPEGGSHWSRYNSRPDYIGTEEHRWPFPHGRLTLGPRRRSPYEAHYLVLDEGGSQLGGFPMWIQHTSHPHCPKCSNLMMFIGQVQTDDALGESGEGVTYAFLCQKCRIAATTYEQT
jgi:hypothetical protein